MPEQPRSELKTQNRVIALFMDKTRPNCLGYDYLVEWNKSGKNRDLKQNMLQQLPPGKIRLK